MSVSVESRSKRILSKCVINEKNKTNFSTFSNTEPIEFDCQIKIKETCYTPKIECIEAVKATNKDYLIVLNEQYENISIEDALNKIESRSCRLIDVRDCRAHRNGCIKKSVLFNCQKRTMMLRAKKSWDLFDDKTKYDSVIVYNQRGEKSSHLDDFFEYIKKDVRKVFFLKGGYEEFVRCADKKFIESVIPDDIIEQYHYSPTNESTKSTDVLNATISEITPFLYLGNELDSRDLDLLNKKQITHILNVTTTVPFAHDGQFIYKRLSASDCNRQDLRHHYKEAINFIDEAKAQNGKVLVHCWAGVSRSATIVAAYLLFHTRLNVLQTICFLQSKRSVVEPNFNFLGQLERYFCDLENGIEPRSCDYFRTVEESAKKAVDIKRVKELSLSSSSESSGNGQPSSPPVPQKPYFNFLK